MDELGSEETRLLCAVFEACHRKGAPVEARKFRAENHEHLEIIDWLERVGLLRKQSEKYNVDIFAVGVIRSKALGADSVYALCGHLFSVLRKSYIRSPGETLTLSEISILADMPADRVNEALHYLTGLSLFDSWGSNADGVINSMTVSEKIVRCKSFEEAMARVQGDRFSASMERSSDSESVSSALRDLASSNSFVHTDRLLSLRAIKSVDVDLSRLIRMCEELDDSYRRENYIAVACLIRAVLDHVPPIFGCRTFAEVANGYPGGGKSVKASLKRLEESARNISDAALHQTIRKKETLINQTTVNFSADFDVLVAEIVRHLSE